MSKKYKVATLGCRTNQYESLAYQNQLKAAGYVEAKGDQEADLCIVNTCTVTQSADSHSRNKIRKLRKQNPGAKIAVTGCMVEESKNKLMEISEADFVISNKTKDQLLTQIFPEEKFPEFALNEVNSQTRAFIKIQDGCNSFCSYCIIPYVRGKSRSKTVDEIVKEVENVVASGTKEIVLTGINIGDFDGGDPKQPVRLSELIAKLEPIEDLERIRISSIDPDEVDDDLIWAINNCSKLCPSMHIVLQSGSNFVLKRMNRKYTRQMFYETIDRLRGISKDFTFTTDIIVGFPGERQSDFEETLAVMKEVKFVKVHMFPYSRRARTKAADFTDQISDEVKSFRKNEVLRLSEKYSYEYRNECVGKSYRVLTESSEEAKITFGHTPNFIKVKIPGAKYTPNQILHVEITANEPDGLVGKVVNETH